MIIQSTKVWIEEQWVKAQLDIQDSKITAVYPYGLKGCDADYGNKKLVPGFIDIHCHGAFGYDTNDINEAGLRHWLKEACKEGVTTLCPTTITQSEEVLIPALKLVSEIADSNPDGAHIGGIHFEGPYLDKNYKGAQPEAYITEADVEQFKRFEKASRDKIKVLTLAPEHDAGYDLIRYAASKGIKVHMGHTDANYEQALLALANGADGFTHSYNRMSPLSHRAIGVTGASLQVQTAHSEIITDGIHVSWPAVSLMYRSKGKYGVVMITDSMQAKGAGAGLVYFGGQAVDVDEQGVAYVHGTKALAGSTLYYDVGFRNLYAHTDADEVSIINSCTINPARVLDLAHRKGLIRANYDADLVVLDEDLSIYETYVSGVLQYRKGH